METRVGWSSSARPTASSLAVLVAAILLALATPASAEEPIQFLTHAKLRSTLQEPLSASWDNMDLRTIVGRIETAKQVAIVIDRRIDPSRIRFANASNEPLAVFVERLAAESSAHSTLVGNVVYIGPIVPSGKLLTLAAIRTKELFDKEERIPDGRRIDLTRAETIRWEDLERPADILRKIAETYELTIGGLEQIPHDLWAGATLPEAGAVEALSLVLVQFDLTFAWTDRGRGIRLEPVPEVVALERAYDAPRGTSAAAALKRWKEALPDLDGRVEKGKVLITGPSETHDLIDRLRRGERIAPSAPENEGPQLKPLKFERYSLKIQQTPAIALLKKLEEPAHGKLTFSYDEAELKAAGIDLAKRVTFEVDKVPIEKLLKSALDPLGVEFEIDLEARTVILKPAR